MKKFKLSTSETQDHIIEADYYSIEYGVIIFKNEGMTIGSVPFAIIVSAFKEWCGVIELKQEDSK